MARREPQSVEHRSVIITGAASGIGRAAAALFCRAGARVAMVDIQAEALAAARAEISSGNPSDGALAPIALAADLSCNADLTRVVAAVRSAFGCIDVLINNAGLLMGGRFEQGDPERLQALIEVNLCAPLRLMQLVLPEMLERGSGHILNVTSSSASLGVPGYAVYAATKSGLMSSSRVLRRELAGSGIHITLLCPGSTATPMTDAMVRFGRGTASQPHHPPEVPAAAMLDAVRRPREAIIVSSRPRSQAVISWLDRIFPNMMDRYWARQIADEDYFECATRAGR